MSLVFYTIYKRTAPTELEAGSKLSISSNSAFHNIGVGYHNLSWEMGGWLRGNRYPFSLLRHPQQASRQLLPLAVRRWAQAPPIFPFTGQRRVPGNLDGNGDKLLAVLATTRRKLVHNDRGAISNRRPSRDALGAQSNGTGVTAKAWTWARPKRVGSSNSGLTRTTWRTPPR